MPSSRSWRRTSIPSACSTRSSGTSRAPSGNIDRRRARAHGTDVDASRPARVAGGVRRVLAVVGVTLLVLALAFLLELAWLRRPTPQRVRFTPRERASPERLERHVRVLAERFLPR